MKSLTKRKHKNKQTTIKGVDFTLRHPAKPFKQETKLRFQLHYCPLSPKIRQLQPQYYSNKLKM